MEETPNEFKKHQETYGLIIRKNALIILLASKEICEMLLPIFQANTQDLVEISNFKEFDQCDTEEAVKQDVSNT